MVFTHLANGALGSRHHHTIVGSDPVHAVPGGGIRGPAGGGVSNLIGVQEKECWTRDRSYHSDHDDRYKRQYHLHL